MPGHGALGNECRLSLHQQQELVERAGRAEFRTYEEARRWVEKEWGVEYRYKGMYALLARLGVLVRRCPVPQPRRQIPKCKRPGKGGPPRVAWTVGAALGARSMALLR